MTQASDALAGTDDLPTPQLLFYEDRIKANIAHVVALAGSPERLRPHVKTHKTAEIARLCEAAGITRHKCATLAEAAVLAAAGARDVLVAYPLVGPGLAGLAALRQRHAATDFKVQVDAPDTLPALAALAQASGRPLTVLVDLDVGMGRTGIPPGPEALALYQQIARTPGLTPGGLHAYDGHVTADAAASRQEATQRSLALVQDLRSALTAAGLPVPRIVMGGSPTFPQYAAARETGLECSPGTFALHDHGYASRYRDLAGLQPAALVATRVISRPRGGRVTLDLGSKAIASDSPAERRCALVGLPDASILLHSEEHLVITGPGTERLALGDVLYAVPAHVCPTVALYREALVVRAGRIADRWRIAARDRDFRGP